MANFIVDESFWTLFPTAKIGVVLLHDYNNQKESSVEIKALLRDSQEKAKRYLVAETFSDNPVVKIYREAYQKFKTKKGARSSIEALLKRVGTDNPVGSINPLVDIYNAASLAYALPVGAEDKETFIGDLRLTITDGGDEFFLIGSDDNTPTLPNELCYKDDKGAVCRCLNWRDGQRTMITEHTRHAFIVIELLDDTREAALHEALDFIQKNSEYHLNATATQYILDRHNPVMSL